MSRSRYLLASAHLPVNGRCEVRRTFLVETLADDILDLHKTFIDDESYNSGHGKAYEFYGIDPKEGALAIIRPDQCTLLLI